MGIVWNTCIDLSKYGEYKWDSVKFHAGLHYGDMIRLADEGLQ